MSKLSPKFLFITAFIFSLLAAFLIYGHLSETQNGSAKMVQVVVAAVDIEPRTIVKLTMLRTVTVPADALQADALTDIQAAVGRISKVAIKAGDQLNSYRVTADRKEIGLTALVPPDKRAITVGVTEVTGLAGLAKVGDNVDIISIINGDTDISGRLILQNVSVLAINRIESLEDSKNKAAEKPATVTLAVTPQESVKLAVAANQGSLQLVLRPIQPTEKYSSNSDIKLQTKTAAPTAGTGAAAAGSVQSYPAGNSNSQDGIIVIRGTGR